MSDEIIQLTPTLNAYLEAHLREHPVLKACRAATHKLSAGHMQISKEQGQLMSFLIECLGARKTLEIGVFTGYSALCVALALPEDGKVIACDINVEWTKMATRFWREANVLHKIDLKLGPALETLNSLILQEEAKSFDFIFIDADKVNYDAYYEKSLQLVRPGGVIAIDNTLWSGKVANDDIQDENTKSIRHLNAKLLKDERITFSLLPIGDGLTLARKRKV